MKINSVNAVNANNINKPAKKGKKIGTLVGAGVGTAISVHGFRDALARNPLKESNPKAALLITAAGAALAIAITTIAGRISGAITDKMSGVITDKIAAKKANTENIQK